MTTIPVPNLTSKLNQFLDAATDGIRARVKPLSGLNLTKVAPTVKRVFRLGDFSSLAMPLVAVQALNWVGDPHSARRFTGTLRWAAHCHVTAGRGDDERELLDFVTDVVRAVMADETFGGLVVYTMPIEFTPNVDQTAPSGYAQAAVTFESLYIWDAATP
jgi:hypothetical protein